MALKYIAVVDATIGATAQSEATPTNQVQVPNLLSSIKAEDLPILIHTLNFLSTECTYSPFVFLCENLTVFPDVGDVYSNNGSNFQILAKWENTDDATNHKINLVCKRTSGTNNPQASGNLTKVSGSGDALIGYTSGSQKAATFITGGGTIPNSAINNIYLDVKPIREDDNGTCRGTFIVDNVLYVCQCNVKVTDAGQTTLQGE